MRNLNAETPFDRKNAYMSGTVEMAYRTTPELRIIRGNERKSAKNEQENVDITVQFYNLHLKERQVGQTTH